MVSALATDGYKLSMAEAGWPLRSECFYYSHRKGGAQLVPFDGEAMVRALLPTLDDAALQYLERHEYAMGIGFRHAMKLHDRLRITAPPKGSWILPREPILSVTGPSALVSWLEPLVLQLHYRIQIATTAVVEPARLPSVVTCEAERAIVLETLDAVGVRPPALQTAPDVYRANVRARAEELARVAGADRIFEVGLRSVCSIEQHLLALEGCKDAGVRRTSHVLGAERLGLIPVGTMGHEHIMRYGDDEIAFRAMRERRPGRSSYLLDTFDTLRSGLPAAYAILAEDPSARDSIRYDSGDKVAQYKHAVALAKARGIAPVHILEDGFDVAQTETFEALRRELGVPESDQFYGYGGFLVSHGAFTRDRVSAVYKLSQTGKRPTMKFANEAGEGKRSVPGRPVIFRKLRGEGPDGIIGQEDERAPEGYGPASAERPAGLRVELSARTRALVRALEEERARVLEALK